MLVGGARGVRFLSPEPAYAAIVIAQMFCATLLLEAAGRLSRKEARLLKSACLVMFVLNRSATVVGLVAIGLVLFSLSHLFKKGFLTSGKLSILAVCLVAVLSSRLAMRDAELVRRVRFLQTVGHAISALRQQSFVTLLGVGGKRLLTVYIGYASLTRNLGLGNGIASHLSDFEELAAHAKVSFSGIMFLSESERYAEALKADSYMASVAMDTGLSGVVVLVAFLIVVWASGFRITRRTGRSDLVFATLGLATFALLFYSHTTQFLQWVLFGITTNEFLWSRSVETHEEV